MKVYVYKKWPEGLNVETKYEENTLWLTQSQISKLLGVSLTAVCYQLKNMFRSRALKEEKACKKMLNFPGCKRKQVVRFYNLSLVMAIGYRINYKESSRFRKWSAKILDEYKKAEQNECS